MNVWKFSTRRANTVIPPGPNRGLYHWRRSWERGREVPPGDNIRKPVDTSDTARSELDLSGEPLWVLKQTRSQCPKHCADNVSSVSYSAFLGLRNRSHVKELCQEPKTDQNDRRDEGNANEKEDVFTPRLLLIYCRPAATGELHTAECRRDGSTGLPAACRSAPRHRTARLNHPRVVL
jgi:hypothetical protein